MQAREITVKAYARENYSPCAYIWSHDTSHWDHGSNGSKFIRERMGDLLFRPAESDNDYEDTKKTAADICGLEDTKFIIPKSGTHFVEVVSLKDKVSVDKVKPLREVCKNGDHYLAQFYPTVERGQGSNHMETGAFSSFVHKVFLLATSISEPLETMSYMYEVVDARRTNATHFYVIKGNSCVKVDNLTDPMTLFSQRESIFTLHQECQGGDFYLANRAGFYIIRSKDNTYLHVRDMSEKGYHPSFASRQKLHESFANGLCYFATEDYFYVLKENAVFGLVYHRTKDLRISDDDVLTVSPSIVKFMKNSPLDEGTVLECSYITLV